MTPMLTRGNGVTRDSLETAGPETVRILLRVARGAWRLALGVGAGESARAPGAERQRTRRNRNASVPLKNRVTLSRSPAFTGSRTGSLACRAPGRIEGEGDPPKVSVRTVPGRAEAPPADMTYGSVVESRLRPGRVPALGGTLDGRAPAGGPLVCARGGGGPVGGRRGGDQESGQGGGSHGQERESAHRVLLRMWLTTGQAGLRRSGGPVVRGAVSGSRTFDAAALASDASYLLGLSRVVRVSGSETQGKGGRDRSQIEQGEGDGFVRTRPQHGDDSAEEVEHQARPGEQPDHR